MSISKWLVLFLISFSGYLFYRRHADRQHLIFKDSARSVQDSMLILRDICESIEPKEFMNCFVVKRERQLIFRGKHLGNIDTVSIFNEGFKGMKPVDIAKLLSTLKYLNRNDISGVYHDTVIKFWMYGYKDDVLYNDIHGIRNIIIWDSPKEIASPIFSHYYKILDRQERMVLISHNNVQYRKF